MQSIVRVATATCVGMLLMTSMLARGQGSDPGVCTGPYINESISPNQLMEILQAHEKWLKSRGKDGQRANLCGAKLPKAELAGANLRQAILTQATLTRANLAGANLTRANLDKADLRQATLNGANLIKATLIKATLTKGVNLHKAILNKADLRQANLSRADLSGAFLSRTNLTGANLNEANLSQAFLKQANLSNASLIRANLHKAKLDNTNLHEAIVRAADFALAIFEPAPGSLPNIKDMRRVENLHLMRFESDSGGLTELREAFKEANMRKEERQVTYALKHTERLKAGWIERLFHYVLFEFTC